MKSEGAYGVPKNSIIDGLKDAVRHARGDKTKCRSRVVLVGGGTDTADFAKAVAEFEERLPGFWWSVGQCSVGAHASCAVDGNGCQVELMEGMQAGEPLDAGFHCDTRGGSPAEALRDVMRQALEYLRARSSSVAST